MVLLCLCTVAVEGQQVFLCRSRKEERCWSGSGAYNGEKEKGGGEGRGAPAVG